MNGERDKQIGKTEEMEVVVKRKRADAEKVLSHTLHRSRALF